VTGHRVGEFAGWRRLLLAAGIGITPALSVLRTAADRDERRPLLLLYGSRHWADVSFREELDDLERSLPNLRVVHVLSRPNVGCQGEQGRIGEDVSAPPRAPGTCQLKRAGLRPSGNGRRHQHFDGCTAVCTRMAALR